MSLPLNTAQRTASNALALYMATLAAAIVRNPDIRVVAPQTANRLTQERAEPKPLLPRPQSWSRRWSSAAFAYMRS
jgi:hypothetical protein